MSVYPSFQKASLHSLWILCLLLVFPGIFPSTAQKQSARYESIRDNRFSDHMVIPADDLGVLVVEQTAIKGGVDKSWKLTFLDKNLQESWETTYVVESSLKLRSWHQDADYFYFLFQEDYKLVADFTILRVATGSGNQSAYQVNNELEFDFSMSTIIEDKIVVGGYVKESPTVLMLNPQEQKISILPGYFSRKGQMLALNVNQGGQSFNVLTQEVVNPGNRMLLKTFSATGQPLFEKAIQLRENIEIYDGMSFGFVEGNIAVAGAYGSFRDMFTQGVFIGIITPDEQGSKLEYHSLAQFERIFDYETQQNSTRLKSKVDQKAVKGKEFKSNLLIDFQEFVYQNGGFIVNAALYHKTTNQTIKSQDHGYGDRKNQRISEYPFRQAMYPFQYDFFSAPTHRDMDFNLHMSTFRDDVLERMGTFVLGFNKQGQVQWDNLLPLLPADRIWLNQLSDAYIGQENVHLLYRHEDKMVFTSVPYTSLSTNEMAVPLLLKEGDKDIRKLYNGVGGVTAWNDTGFLIWGYSRIRSKDGKRNVMYINKVDF